MQCDVIFKDMGSLNFNCANGNMMAADFQGETTITIDFQETIKTCKNMFNSLYVTSIDLSQADFSSVSDLTDMFKNCLLLTSVNFGSFNTFISTKTTERMFQSCTSLESIDLSSFNFTINNLNNMFDGCSNLKSIDISNIKTTENTNTTSVFSKLFEITIFEYI